MASEYVSSMITSHYFSNGNRRERERERERKNGWEGKYDIKE
jgi:hypothetical protein